MNIYIQAKATYKDTVEETNKTEIFLVEADNATEAEARVVEELDFSTIQNLAIPDLNIKKFHETVQPEEAELLEGVELIWYVGKASIVSIDENSGREKKMTYEVLIGDYNYDRAYKAFKKVMEKSQFGYEMLGLAKSKIVDILRK